MKSITNYAQNADWFYILPAIAVVDFLVILLSKYPSASPVFGVAALNKWYDDFGVFAVLSDILSIAIGIAAARYIYGIAGLHNPLYFLAILVAFQLAHDILFYIAVIQPIPANHNRMIDVFKAYGTENGWKILVSDALMMLGSVGLASYLKSLPNHFTTATALVTVYAICYVVFTRTPATK